MKKLFSIILMAALLVTCITPALYSSAADVPSFVVEENIEYDENASTVDVSFGIADNPGISEMTVLVYYLGEEMSIAGFSNGEVFNTPDNIQGATQASNSRNMASYFPSEEFGDVVYNVTQFTVYAPTLDADETGNGTFLNVTFNLDGEHAAGAQFTYGIKVMTATNLAGDAVEFSGKQEGTVTSLPDPYKDIYENFTVFTTEANVDVDATEATVELRLVNNPGINSIRVFIVYDEELEMTSMEPVDGIFFGEEHTPGAMNGAPEDNASAIAAFENMGLSMEGKACAIYVAAVDSDENRTTGGVLARLTFALPEDLQQGESFPIDFCWTEGDVLQLSDSETDESGNPIPIRLNPDRPTCYINVEACEHPNVVLQTVKDATCTEEGLRSGVCPDCGQTVEEVIPMIPHTPADEPKVIAPTCTEPGYIVEVCSVCGTEIGDREVDPANSEPLGHDLENATEEITKPATCTETGLKNILCGRCGEVIEENVEIPMIPHEEEVRVEEPTCTEPGYLVTVCSVCETELGREVDPDHPEALGHEEGAPVVTKPATCQEEGTQEIYCVRCEELIRTETIEKLPHTEVTETIDPTCTEDGAIIVTCSVCGEELSRTVLPATGHVEAAEPVIVPPTCVDDGKIQIVCSVCGTVLSEVVDEDHPATGIHTPGEPEIIEPTATEDGSITIKCSVCGEVLSVEIIPATGEETTDTSEPADTTAPSDTTNTSANNNNSDRAPTTGDNMIFVIIVAAVAIVGCAAVIVIRKRKAAEK